MPDFPESLRRLPFVYVDCGARGDSKKPFLKAFPNTRYIGFEPDKEECARLSAQARAGYEYLPMGAGGREERRILYVTRNPSCSSLLQPDDEVVQRYRKCGEFFAIDRTSEIEVVQLDRYLPAHGIPHVDVLELDAQGAEAEILDGAQALLHSSVLAVQVEVEFVPLYRDQPLFGDIDARLRQSGLEIFGLTRYQVTRKEWPPELRTRGQLLWGQATYLKRSERAGQADSRLKLAAIAWFLGFGDYALEIVDGLLAQPGLVDKQRRELLAIRRQLTARSQNGRLIAGLLRLERSPLKGLLRRLGSGASILAKAIDGVTTGHHYVAKD